MAAGGFGVPEVSGFVNPLKQAVCLVSDLAGGAVGFVEGRANLVAVFD